MCRKSVQDNTVPPKTRNMLRAHERTIFGSGALYLICGCTLTLAALAGYGSAVSRSSAVEYTVSFVPIALGLFAVYRESYRLGALLMLIGGIATIPVGLFAIVGALSAISAYRMARRTSIRDASLPKCLKCGYDMRALPFPRCPECGCLLGFRKTAEELTLTEEELNPRRRD